MQIKNNFFTLFLLLVGIFFVTGCSSVYVSNTTVGKIPCNDNNLKWGEKSEIFIKSIKTLYHQPSYEVKLIDNCVVDQYNRSYGISNCYFLKNNNIIRRETKRSFFVAFVGDYYDLLKQIDKKLPIVYCNNVKLYTQEKEIYNNLKNNFKILDKEREKKINSLNVSLTDTTGILNKSLIKDINRNIFYITKSGITYENEIKYKRIKNIKKLENNIKIWISMRSCSSKELQYKKYKFKVNSCGIGNNFRQIPNKIKFNICDVKYIYIPNYFTAKDKKLLVTLAYQYKSEFINYFDVKLENLSNHDLTIKRISFYYNGKVYTKSISIDLPPFVYKTERIDLSNSLDIFRQPYLEVSSKKKKVEFGISVFYTDQTNSTNGTLTKLKLYSCEGQ